MADIKYQYAYYIDKDEEKVISIADITEENRKLYNFRCISCGHELLPRAIDSKHRRPHFYHKEIINCSGETYLHKLSKHIIKEKFDSSPTFFIEYNVTKKCNNDACKYRNLYCQEEYSPYKVDLKKYYDTCTEETAINGFVADLLLTNSEKTEIEPILIEICVSHPCDENKIKSGLRIIEIKIRNEQDIISLLHKDIIKEDSFSYDNDNAKFISFKTLIPVPFHVKLQRYIYNPKTDPIGYLTEVDCTGAKYKLRKDSLLELNVFYTNDYKKCEIWDVLQWLSKHKGLRRCNLCKFYYATLYEKHAICRLSKKYGKPAHPSMDEAERCNSYSPHSTENTISNLKDVVVEEVTALSSAMKPEFKVILAVSPSFENYILYRQKILHYIKEKRKTHNIIFITGASWVTDIFTREFIEEFGFNTEPHRADWGKYGQAAMSKANDEMTSAADALIAFWDGKSTGLKDLINQAEKKGIKVAVVNTESS